MNNAVVNHKNKSGLEALFRLRRGLERAAKLELKRISSEINRADGEMERIAHAKRELYRQLLTSLERGCRAEAFALYAPDALDREARCLKNKIQQLKALKVGAERTYVECQRERKIIEKALERKQREKTLEATRQEQRTTDDATLRRMAWTGQSLLRNSS